MAGSIVALRITQSSPTSQQLQPPQFGVVTDDTNPLSQVVRWATTVEATIAGAALADLNLDVIMEASAATKSKFNGRTVLRIASTGPKQGDPAGGTSREFVGTVIAVYRRTPLENLPVPPGQVGPEYLLVKTGDMYIEDLATQFAVLKDR